MTLINKCSLSKNIEIKSRYYMSKAKLPLSSQNHQHQSLNNMRRKATLLFILISLVYFITVIFFTEFWLAQCINAFAEAAIVGALADWFAVVALFKRPLGLPIPHTSIIPANKEKIAASIGQFIASNFLSRKAINKKLLHFDLISVITDWLVKEENLNKSSNLFVSLMPELTKIIPEAELRRIIELSARRGAEKISLSTIAAHLLDILWVNGEAQIILDRIIVYLGDLLVNKEEYIKSRVSHNAPKWMPKWIDSILVERVLNGIMLSLKNLQDPSHKWRKDINKSIEKLIKELENDPEYFDKGEALKTRILSDPVFIKQMDYLWTKVKDEIINEFSTHKLSIKDEIKFIIINIVKFLQSNPGVKNKLNRFIRLTLIKIITPRRDQIGLYVNEIICSWDSETLVHKIELNVGKDLQYIRINGTLIGGLAGLLLYILTHFLLVLR